MGNNFIATTEKRGVASAMVGGSKIIALYPQLKLFIQENKLGEDFENFFSEPVEDSNSIDWYSDRDGKPVCFLSLPQEEQNSILTAFQNNISALKNLIAGMRENVKNPKLSQTAKESLKNYAAILEKSLNLPSLKYLYCINGKPVMTGWGLSESDQDVVHDGIISETMVRYQKKLEDDIKITTKQAVEPQPSSDPTPPQPEQQPAPVEIQEKKKFPILPIIIAVVLILLAILAWFLMKTPPPPPVPTAEFPMGEYTITDILKNENNEMLDFSYNFPDQTGKGICTVKSGNNKVCKGDISASMSNDTDILYSVSELKCSDNDNFGPSQLVCTKQMKDCTLTDKAGAKMPVSLKKKGE